MKKLLCTLGILFAAGGLHASWTTPPPASATVNSSITIAANGNAIYPGPNNYNVSLLVIWWQSPSGSWSNNPVGSGAAGGMMSGSRTINLSEPGTWHFQATAVFPSTPPAQGSAPYGNTLAGPNSTDVPNPIVPTTFTFSNLSFTYDGGMKTASVTPSPGNATYTADLTKGPGPGTYTVSAMASGNFSGSNSANLIIDPPPNHPPSISWANNPATAYVNQWFNVQARGDDQDGNISYVDVWKEGSPFAFDGFPNGYTRYSDNNAAMSSVPGTVTFTAKAGDSNGAESATISHTVTIINRAPMITMSASPVSINFGQTTNITSTATDADSNLAFHGILVLNEASNDWYRAPGTDHSMGWGNHPVTTDFTAVNYTSGSASGSTSTRTATHRPSYTGLPRTITYHSNAHDGVVWASSDETNWAACVGYAYVVVNKATPNQTGWADQSRTGKGAFPAAFSVTFSNPYTTAVTQPTGAPTFSVTSATGVSASPTSGAVGAGTIFSPGSYSILCSYPGDANYIAQTWNATFTVVNVAPTAAMSIKGVSSGTTTAVIGETLTIGVSGADSDANLRAVNLWVLAPSSSVWRNIRADNGLTAGSTEDASNNSAINSVVDVPSLGSLNRTYAIPLLGSGGGTGTYKFVVRSIDATGMTSASQEVDVTVSKASQPILTLAAAATQTYGSTQTLSSTGGASGAGITTSYSIAGQSATGVATLSDNVLKATASTGWVDVQATRSGNDDYNAATSATVRVTLGKAPLTITADNKSREYGDPNPTTFTVHYAGFAPWENENTPGVLSSMPSASTVATTESPAGSNPDINVSGATATNYTINHVKGTLTITPRMMQFSFLGTTCFYDGTPKQPTTVQWRRANTNDSFVPAPSELWALRSPQPASPYSDRVVAASATQKPPTGYNGYYFQVEGVGNYGGIGECLWTIVCCVAQVDLPAETTFTYDGSAKSATATSSSPSGLQIQYTYDNNPGLVPILAGDYTVHAEISDPVWGGHSDPDGVLRILPADQAAFKLPTARDLPYNEPLDLTTITPASGTPDGGSGEGTTVSYLIIGQSAGGTASLSGLRLDHLIAPAAGGWVDIQATRSTGTDGKGGVTGNYKPKTSTPLHVRFIKANQAALVFTPATTPPGYVTPQVHTTTQTLQATGGSAGAYSYAVIDQSPTGGAYTLDGDQLTASNGYGWVTVRATRAGDNNYNSVSADATVLFTKKTVEVTLGGLDQTYDGSPKSITATVDPAAVTHPVTVNKIYPDPDPSTPPTTAGSYNVIGVIDDLDYQGQTGGILLIRQATPAISWTPTPLTYGEVLGAAQLNATASLPGPGTAVAGTYAYVPPAGTLLAAGPRPLSVIFNATDTVNYTLLTPGSATLTVNKATPVGTMLPPARTISTSGNSYVVRASDLSATWERQTPVLLGVVQPSAQQLNFEVVGGITIFGGTPLPSPAVLTIRAIYPGDDNYTSASVDAVWTLTSSPTDTGATELRVHRPN